MPIIFFLLIIFSFALLCIGLALTPFLAPDAPKAPAAGIFFGEKNLSRLLSVSLLNRPKLKYPGGMNTNNLWPDF
ncbi:MAG: hypothetical protein ACL93V_11370 [Candidatus Electrothrix sp. YB6]